MDAGHHKYLTPLKYCNRGEDADEGEEFPDFIFGDPLVKLEDPKEHMQIQQRPYLQLGMA